MKFTSTGNGAVLLNVVKIAGEYTIELWPGHYHEPRKPLIVHLKRDELHSTAENTRVLVE